MLGKKLKDVDLKVNGRYYVKLSVFPFNRLKGADPVLGPEMKSTGEVMGIGKNFNEALFKAFISVYKINKKSVLLSLNDENHRFFAKPLIIILRTSSRKFSEKRSKLFLYL